MTTFTDNLTDNLGLDETGSGALYNPRVAQNDYLQLTEVLAPNGAFNHATSGDTLAGTDGTTESVYRTDVLVATLTLTDVLTGFTPVNLTLVDALGITELLSPSNSILAASIEALAMTDEAIGGHAMTLVLVDAVSADDVSVGRAAFSNILTDTLLIGLSLRSGGEEWVAWVANTTTAAHAFWDSFRFNALAHDIGGVAYGTMDDGIYAIDDRTQSIYASLLTGRMDFGDSRLKGVPKILLGGTAGGAMYVRVVQDNQTQYTYRATPVYDTPDTLELNPGRGIRSRYLQFEIVNGDGSDFDLQFVEFFPLQLTRQR